MLQNPAERQNQQNYQDEFTNIAKNTGIGGSGILLGNIVLYLSSILITRTVGADYYGIYYLGTNIVGVIGMVISFGVSSGVLKYISLYNGLKDYSRIKGLLFFNLKLLIVSSCIASIVIFFAASFISQHVFKNEDLDFALKILALSLPFSILSTVLVSSLQGLRLIKYSVSVNNIIYPLTRLILLLSFFFLGLHFAGLLYAQTISLILAFIAAGYLLLKSFPFGKYQALFDQQKEFFSFSRPLYFQQFFNYGITSLPIFLLSYYHTSADTGIYGIAMRLNMLVGFPLVASNMIFAPTISMLYGKGDKATLERLLKTVTKWVFTISFFIFLIIILFANPILQIFGKEFTKGEQALYFIVFGEAVNVGVGAVGFILMMTGRTKINLINSIVLFTVTLVSSYIFIPIYGVLGAGIATAVPIILVNLLSVGEVYYFERIHPFSFNYLKPLIAGIIALVSTFILKYLIYTKSLLSIGILSLFFTFIYIVVLLALKLDKEDESILHAIKRKIYVKKN